MKKKVIAIGKLEDSVVYYNEGESIDSVSIIFKPVTEDPNIGRLLIMPGLILNQQWEKN